MSPCRLRPPWRLPVVLPLGLSHFAPAALPRPPVPVSGLRSPRRASSATGGDEQIRTVDPLLARQVLSHLSYTPIPIALTSSPLAKAVSQVLQSAPHL